MDEFSYDHARKRGMIGKVFQIIEKQCPGQQCMPKNMSFIRPLHKPTQLWTHTIKPSQNDDNKIKVIPLHVGETSAFLVQSF